MTRREIRADGLAEPISHYTDAVVAGELLFISGLVGVDRHGALVGGEDVAAQTRQVFANMRVVLDEAGCRFEDVVKVTVYLTDIDDRPKINPVRQEVFGDARPASTLVEVSRLAVPGAKVEIEAVALIPRVMMASEDRWNAFITRVDAAEAGPGPLAGRTLGVKDLIDTAGIRTTYGSNIYRRHVPERNAVAVQRLLDAGAVLIGKTHLPEFAWSVLGVSPWYGTCGNPAHPGRTTGGSSSGSAAALAAGLCELALGTDTGCSIRLPAAACEIVGLKSQWGLIPMEGVFPLCPTLDTVGPLARSVADVALMWSVLTGRPAPEPRLAGLTIGLLRQPPETGDGRATERSDLAEAWGAALERQGARVVEASVPEPAANTWPLFQHEAAQSHAATFPSRADEYGALMRGKLEAAQHVPAEDVAAAYRAIEVWRGYEPDVDLYVSPCYAVELPPEDVDELEIRLPLTSFLRWVNLIGWAALAIGNLQLIAPTDEVVLAAGLAWERATGP